MRVFAISDLHVDYAENKSWVAGLSSQDYQRDVLICAGDISHRIAEVAETFQRLRKRFRAVAYVPGNHELWVNGNGNADSLEKFGQVQRLATEEGIQTGPLHLPEVSVSPLHAWYDHSFGQPSADLLERWADYQFCSWPEGFDQAKITEYFLSQNQPFLRVSGKPVISFSHFVPRSDLLPESRGAQFLRPVLGSGAIDAQIRQIGSFLHIYGHYHVNGRREREGVTYINNALGYPCEAAIAAKRLLCVFET
jgi:predicted phosphodiesterase